MILKLGKKKKFDVPIDSSLGDSGVLERRPTGAQENINPRFSGKSNGQL